MSSKGLESWFTSKKKLVKELEEVLKQLSEAKLNISRLESESESWRKKSHTMDLLGNEEEFRRLVEYGSLDSIFKRLEDYERLQSSNKQLEKQNKRLKSNLEEEDSY